MRTGGHGDITRPRGRIFVCISLMQKYRALLWKYRALLWRYRALMWSLLQKCWAQKYRAHLHNITREDFCFSLLSKIKLMKITYLQGYHCPCLSVT